jgi:aspartyl-tRNA(Asn)/glutamyl-tRNA(Gln) amidotransferase subunit A
LKRPSIFWPVRTQPCPNWAPTWPLNEAVTLAQAQRRPTPVWLLANTAARCTGVPMAHKDIFVTKDFPTTAGSKMLDWLLLTF